MARNNDLVTSILKREGEKIFEHSQPIVLKKKHQQQELLNQWKKEIESLKAITADRYFNYGDTRLSISIKITSDYVNDVSLELTFDEEGRLCLRKKWYSSGFRIFIATIEALQQYAEALQKASTVENKRYERSYKESVAKAHKREKIKSLKQQAIIAKLNELCRAEGISYDVYTGYQYKLKLVAVLSKKQRMEVDIPYNNYQSVLQKLPATLKSLQLLSESGMVFRIKSR